MKYAILFLVFSVSLFAKASPTCSTKGTVVFYTNGINTSEDSALEALDEKTTSRKTGGIIIGPQRALLLPSLTPQGVSLKKPICSSRRSTFSWFRIYALIISSSRPTELT
jgi:hypothetical protein